MLKMTEVKIAEQKVVKKQIPHEYTRVYSIASQLIDMIENMIMTDIDINNN